jgi:hypothetical protein
MTTITTKFTTTCEIDDAEFHNLGGTELHVLHLEDNSDGFVDVVFEGSVEATAYICNTLRGNRCA